MATILLVEDNPHIMNINEKALSMHGYQVLCAQSIAHASALLSFHRIDLMVLDIMLPDGDGIAFCKACKQGANVPVLFLSAMSENADIIKGLRAGGDDYLTKPYDLEVFLARVETRLRGSLAQERMLQFGALTFNMVAMTAMMAGQDLRLTQKEFSVLLLLAKNQNGVVSKKVLCQSVWGALTEEDTSALWTVISRLKKKLNSADTGIVIWAKRNEGYVLEQNDVMR